MVNKKRDIPRNIRLITSFHRAIQSPFSNARGNSRHPDAFRDLATALTTDKYRTTKIGISYAKEVSGDTGLHLVILELDEMPGSREQSSSEVVYRAISVVSLDAQSTGP